MGRPSASTSAGANADQLGVGGTPLQGHWLFLARMGWIAIFILTLVLFCANLMSRDNDVVTTILVAAATSVWFAVSLVLFWRKSTDGNILLMSLGLVLLGGVFFPPYPFALFQWNLVWGDLVGFLEFLAWAAFNIFYLFPDGRFVPSFTRWLALGWLVLSLVANVSGALWYWPFGGLLLSLVRLTFYCSLALVQLYRYRWASTSVQRQQTKWVVFAFTIVILGWSVTAFVLFVVLGIPGDALGISSYWGSLLNELLGTTAFYLLPVLIPLSFGIALLRYRLWDIDIIINRTLVYAVFTVGIVAFYVLVVVGLGTLFQAQGNFGIALLATGLVAVLFSPARNRLQRLVNHLMYGDRDDPYRVISRLGHHLEATLTPDAVLPTIVETVAQALKLPYAAITLRQGDALEVAASYGSLKDEPVRLALVYQNEQVGELALAPRAPGESFTPADRALLEDLARQVGIAAHAVRLTAALKQLTIDLQHSRERLVTAREEERRRLRRDLHDGLGPQLATLTLKLETARNRLAHEPLADPLFADLTARTQAAVTDIRRLVYALRPPALDELGLLAALREQALQYSDQLHIHLDLPESLPPLSAAVEVALYRVAQEALTNVVRHAHASHCTVHLALDETGGILILSIQDDGCGLLSTRRGIGLTSMRERAAELGGIHLIERVPTGGTRVLTQLPYAHIETAGPVDLIPTSVQHEEE